MSGNSNRLNLGYTFILITVVMLILALVSKIIGSAFMSTATLGAGIAVSVSFACFATAALDRN